MKLSEAIRLGATIMPQRFGSASNGSDGCAIYSACVAAGINYWDFHYPEGWIIRAICPECNEKSKVNTVIHLNDDHLWTRERIADWVEVIELEQDINRTTTTEKENECQIA